MKAVRFNGVGKPASIADVPQSKPGPGQVLMKIGGAGVCHSDLHVHGPRLRPCKLVHLRPRERGADRGTRPPRRAFTRSVIILGVRLKGVKDRPARQPA
jgi:hypothetical protein